MKELKQAISKVETQLDEAQGAVIEKIDGEMQRMRDEVLSSLQQTADGARQAANRV